MMQVFDFTESGSGLLVKYSAHHRNELCIPADAPEFFGIVKDKEFLEVQGVVVCYPRVHWEGRAMSTLCHPANVDPVRPHALPTIDI
ncbi:hypothetical protein [Duganella vulcania]|uniref:Uncharacterized protein n=1 Tax=Duganella vulcania TaxID=2692166 RepID=A0A845GGB1_9BURK|nr:hypothetical protein [Duganella vulcania]MYM92550.1 hypothetical protein [Duganella vulcania]